MFLNFNTEGINFYFLCPFACFFFLVFSSLTAGSTEFGKYPYTQNIIVSLGEMLGIIPYIISVNIEKETYKEKEERISLNSEINSSDRKKSLMIQLEYNKMEDNIPLVPIRKILILGFVDFLQSLSFFYGNNVNDVYQIYFWSSIILFLCIFSKYLLKIKLYKHHFFSFGVLFFLYILHIIFILLDYKIKKKILRFILLLVSSICFTFELVYEKKIIEKHFISPFKLCFLIGFSSLIYNIIASIIITIISSNVELSDYHFSFIDYFSDIKENNKLLGELFCIFIFMILMGLHNIFQFLIIKHLSPNHAVITQILLAFYLSILFTFTDEVNTITCIVGIVVNSIGLCILFIFLEIIEIKCWGLDLDTIHNINRRAFEDKNMRSLSENNENGYDSDEERESNE